MIGPINRVAITGMGVLAANGIGLKSFWDTLVRGESGIGPITLFDAEGLKCQIAGEVSNFVPEEWIDSALNPKRMSRSAQFATVAGKLAIEDAGLDHDLLTKRQPIPFIVGVCTSALDVLGKKPNALTACASLPNASVTSIGRLHHVRTRNITVSNACTSGLDAICLAADMVRRGEADIALTGGVDASLTRYSIEALLRCKRCCTRHGNPRKASRPFDRNRDRGVIAEGAGIVVLESWEHALARGVSPRAEIVSHNSNVDVENEDEGFGLQSTMSQALANAGLRPKHIDCILAHGPSDSDMDAVESRAIKRVFGHAAYSIPVTSIKGVTGCAMGAGGAHQVVAGVMAIQENLIPPTANFEEGDDCCDLDYVPFSARRTTVGHALVNAHGIGQGNASLILGAP